MESGVAMTMAVCSPGSPGDDAEGSTAMSADADAIGPEEVRGSRDDDTGSVHTTENASVTDSVESTGADEVELPEEGFAPASVGEEEGGAEAQEEEKGEEEEYDVVFEARRKAIIAVDRTDTFQRRCFGMVSRPFFSPSPPSTILQASPTSHFPRCIGQASMETNT